MTTYQLSPIFEPQFVALITAGLVFAPSGAGGGIVVPTSFNYQILGMRVANVSASPCWLKVWRVPLGGSVGDWTLVVPSINIPVATQSFPYFDLTALWGAILRPGDAIQAEAQMGNVLVIHADGALITL